MKKILHINGRSFDVEVKSGSASIEVLVNDKPHVVDLSRIRQSGFTSVIVDGESFEVFCEQKGESHYLLWLGHHSYEVKFGAAFGAGEEEETISTVYAPMPGLIAKLHVAAQDKVSKGDSLLILEAMKMQNDLKSPRDGIIKEILVEEGAKVALQDKLIILE